MRQARDVAGVPQDYKLMEVRLSSLADVQLAVISRLKRDQLTVSRRAPCAQSTVDPRVTVTFDQHSFPSKKPISFTVQVRRLIALRYCNVNVNVNVNVQYLSTRESCNKELRRLRHEGCLQQTTELC